MTTFDERHGGLPGSARPQVSDGEVDVLGHARIINGHAVGELFLDRADGSVVVVLRQATDGAVQVDVYNRDRQAMDVFVDGEIAYTAPTF